MRLWICALIAFSGLCGLNAGPGDNAFVIRAIAGGGGPTPIASDDFEGTGTPSGDWYTGFGTVSFDNTTSPLSGAQQLRLTSAAGVGRTFTASSTLWTRGRFRLNQNQNDGEEKFALYNNTTRLAYIESEGSGNFIAGCGSTASSATSGLTQATHLRVWTRYAKGTGSNAQFDVYISTTDTRPGSPTISITTGTATLDADNYWFQCSTGGQSLDVDDMEVFTSDPGNF